MDRDPTDQHDQTYAEWVASRAECRAPEVDYGTTWTSAARPDTTWRISWNTGSHELIAVTATGDTAQRLGWYATVADVESVLYNWPSRTLDPRGLDAMRAEIADWNQAEAEYRQDMVDYLLESRNDEVDPPGWYEYTHTCDRYVEVDGHGEWRRFIDIDYDEWDRLSPHPQWGEYLDAMYALPEDVERADPFEAWLATTTPTPDTPQADREPFPPTARDESTVAPELTPDARDDNDKLGAPGVDQSGTFHKTSEVVATGGPARTAVREIHPTDQAADAEHRIVDRWLARAAGAGQTDNEGNLRRWADAGSQTPDQPRFGRRQPRQRPGQPVSQATQQNDQAPSCPPGKPQLGVEDDRSRAAEAGRPGGDVMAASPPAAVRSARRSWYRRSAGRELG